MRPQAPACTTPIRTSAARLPTPRSAVAAVLYHGMILVLGGELPPDHTFPDNEAYNPKTDRWTTFAPMPAFKMVGTTEVRSIE